MTWGDLAVMTTYAALALLALLTTRRPGADGQVRDYELSIVGVSLALSFGASNLVYFLAPMIMRAPLYTLLEVAVSTAAGLAFAVKPRWGLVLMVAASAVSVCFNVRFATAVAASPAGVPWLVEYEHALGTNLCFAVECLCAIWLGVSGELRHRGIGRRPADRHLVPGQDAAAQAVADFPGN